MRWTSRRSARPAREFARVYAPEALAADSDASPSRAPVSLAFEIEKDKDRFRLEGRVRTTLVLPCSRCLEGFELDVDAPFDLRYQPKDAGARRTMASASSATTICRRRSTRTTRSSSIS